MTKPQGVSARHVPKVIRCSHSPYYQTLVFRFRPCTETRSQGALKTDWYCRLCHSEKERERNNKAKEQNKSGRLSGFLTSTAD